MRLGLGLTIVSSSTPAAPPPPPAYDPAVLALTGWWRASFAASPWVGTASAGASGSRDLTEAVTPPAVGAPLNSLDPADFDGTNDKIVAAGITDNYVNGNAGSVWILFNARTGVAAPGAAAPYATDGLFNDLVGAGLNIGFSTAGFQAGFYDLVSWDSAIVAASTGAWHLGQAKWDGSTIKARVDSSAWASVARGNLNIGGVLQVGKNFDPGTFFDGLVADVGVIDAVLSDSGFDDIKEYVNDRYALSL